MSFFGGNPFGTPVGQRIEQATDAALASENWALNMEICDLINETEDGPKDALKALRKRLQQNVGKNYTVVMYTLTVLETCVKNCGKRFHVLACSKEFVQDMVKLIGPKNDPPTAVQEKVLSLIQSWADAFRTQPDMAGVVQVYNDLRQKGIEFPMTDLDTLAPIHTPRRTVPEAAAPAPPPPVPRSPQPAPSPPPAPLSTEQLAKLRSELDVVRGNMAVLSEMLGELTPGREHPSDLELLTELHATCQAMQQRLVELVERVASDEVTAELLHLNDELNNLFLRYGRYERNRDASLQQSPAKAGADSAPQEETAALIDLGEELPSATAQKPAQLAGQLSALSLGPAPVPASHMASSTSSKLQTENEDSEFDMFAQSRKVTYEASKKGGSTYMDNTHMDQTNMSLGAAAQARNNVMHCESDFDEMEAWLHSKPKDATAATTVAAGATAATTAIATGTTTTTTTAATTGTKSTPPTESLSSSEFDRFLAERAAAAETLPPVPVPGSAPASNQQQPGNQGRRMDKEEAEGSLFAL